MASGKAACALRGVRSGLSGARLSTAGVDMDALAIGLGRVLELKNAVAVAVACSQEPVRRYAAADLAAVAATARRLLLLCLDHVRPVFTLRVDTHSDAYIRYVCTTDWEVLPGSGTQVHGPCKARKCAICHMCRINP